MKIQRPQQLWIAWSVTYYKVYISFTEDYILELITY
jgi:hypothetical protein